MAAICLENTNARRIPIISEEVTQGMEFELGVVSENGGLKMDWSFITYLRVRIKKRRCYAALFCSDKQ